MNVELTYNSEEQLDRVLWSFLVRKRANDSCENCGRKDIRLHAHHKNRDNKDNRLSNGACLCGSCHKALHWELAGGLTEEHKQSIREGLLKAHAEGRHNAGESISKAQKKRWNSYDESKIEEISRNISSGRKGIGTKTHCKNGHEFTKENTITRERKTSTGIRIDRQCRICSSQKQRENYSKRQKKLGRVYKRSEEVRKKMSEAQIKAHTQ